MNSKIYTENFMINIKDFKTSIEFSNHLCDFLSKFACNRSITYPSIIYVDLNDRIHSISFLFVYPYIDKDLSYEIFLKGKITGKINKLFVRISYTR
jgi:hypothetical protein